MTSTDADVLARLYQTILARRGADPAGSYTARLLAAGVTQMAKKLGEEATEAVIAATRSEPGELARESADILYHLMVLWVALGVTPEQVYAELARREGRSGIEEKQSRAPR